MSQSKASTAAKMSSRVSTPESSTSTTEDVLASTKNGIKRLYEIYDYLASAQDKTEKERLFQELIEAVGASIKEKRLACQLISKFIKDYPALQMAALDVMLDLFEIEDVPLRKQTQKELVTVCKELPHVVDMVAFTITQIFQSSDNTELAVTVDSLRSLISINTELCLTGMFAQIRYGEYVVIDRSIKFLGSHLKHIGSDLTPKVEKLLFKEIGKSIKQFDSMKHFMIAMEILGLTAFIKTPDGKGHIVKMLEIILEAEKRPIFVAGRENIAKLLICSDYLFPFFHGKNSSAPLFAHYCLHVLPNISEASQNVQFSLLRMAVELTSYFEKLDSEQNKSCLKALLNVADDLLKHYPLDLEASSVPVGNYSFLENILYMIHKLECTDSEAFNEVANEVQFKELKVKVTYLLRVVAAYKARLKADLQQITKEDLKRESVKITCLRTLTNIGDISKHLLRKTELKKKVLLSWKAPLGAQSLEFEQVNKTGVVKAFSPVRKCRNYGSARIYHPPTGKYSSRNVYVRRLSVDRSPYHHYAASSWVNRLANRK